MIRLPTLPARAVELGAALALIASVAGFQATQTFLLARLFLLALTVLALILALSGRDKVFLALLTVYAGSALLIGLLLSEALPVIAVFPAVFVQVTLVGTYLLLTGEREDYAAGLGIGLLVVELIWFLSLWPFDPQSKAAVATMLFYGIWLVVRRERQDEPMRLRDWLTGGVWLSIVLLVVVWFAEWHI